MRLLLLEKAPLNDFGKQFPVPRNTAARKIGNGVILLLWQLRCHWNPYHNKFSSLSNTTVPSPGNFSKSLFIARSLFSNVRGIDREKMRWATSAITSWIVFLQEILLITDSFFHKIKFARTFKKCFPSVRFGCRKYFFCRY